MTPNLPFGFVRDDSSENMAASDDAAAVADTARTVDVFKRNAALQHHSRAFDRFFAPEEAEQGSDGRFFVPSYLAGSTYIRKLTEAHKSKLQAQRESKRNGNSDFASNLTGFTSPALPPGAHRGMTHTIIERPPPSPEEDALAPLPSSWNKDDQWGGIEIQPDGRTVKYVGPRSHHERDQEACAVRADHYMPPQCGIYYYEVEILSSKKDDTTIAIGFCTKTAQLSRPIGWEPESWGYHGDDGRCFTAQNTGRVYGPTFNQGDVIGCGVNFREHKAFFTKNGVRLGNAFQEAPRGKIYPSISLKKPGELVRANFGQQPFVFNIEDVIKEQQDQIYGDIQATDTSQLQPDMNETDLIQALVLQFLQHDGYVETARGFAEEMKAQKQALTLDPTARVEGINIRDDEDANNRQRIRSAILDGDIDSALKLTQEFYPNVLAKNHHVHFRLKCRKFIEMVRRAAQMHMASDSSRSNGHAGVTNAQTMDLDQSGNDNTTWDVNMDSEALEISPELVELERSMLVYGQSLQAEYMADSRKDVTKALAEIWVLVAYKNPLKEPKVSHLLDRKGRVAVAEELNSAILLSLGKSSRAALETVYAQTNVLLEDLRQDGGVGAFVSVQDIVDDIPTSNQS